MVIILNEGKVVDRIKDWIDKGNKRLGYDGGKTTKNSKKPSTKKDKSSQKEKGFLTEEDISNAISLIKKVIGGNSIVGKHLELKPMSDIMAEYSISEYDFVCIGTLYVMNPDDPDDQDVLIPHDESEWFKGDFKERCKEISNLVDSLCDKLQKECSNKYGDSFKFDFDTIYYAYLFYVDSVKPKNAENKSLNEAASKETLGYSDMIRRDKSLITRETNNASKKVYETFRNSISDRYKKDLEEFYNKYRSAPKVDNFFLDDCRMYNIELSCNDGRPLCLFYQDKVCDLLNKSEKLKALGYSFETEDYPGIIIFNKNVDNYDGTPLNEAASSSLFRFANSDTQIYDINNLFQDKKTRIRHQ